jgi:hypothetical protein
MASIAKLKDTAQTNKWLYAGLSVLAACAVASFIVVSKNSKTFAADNSFSTLAGFVVLALVLERFCEAVLAPWWGTAPAAEVKAAAETAQGTAASLPPPVKTLLDKKSRLGVADARALVAQTAKVKSTVGGPSEGEEPEATKAAAATADAADSAWVQATISRPTILLPAAGLASMACAGLHLFLVHGIAKVGSGLPNSKLAFAADAVITGLALAGGAKPFHDLIQSITPSASK